MNVNKYKSLIFNHHVLISLRYSFEMVPYSLLLIFFNFLFILCTVHECIIKFFNFDFNDLGRSHKHEKCMASENIMPNILETNFFLVIYMYCITQFFQLQLKCISVVEGLLVIYDNSYSFTALRS